MKIWIFSACLHVWQHWIFNYLFLFRNEQLNKSHFACLQT
jgi:hypothetical protein